MVKNKGFTLVELLAVIVIIGATSILIVPKLIERFEVKKEDLNKQAKELLYLADLGIESMIINAEVENNIFKVLEDEDVKGTVISRGN